MTFVYPLLLGGLVFAGIPVLLHFLVRQKPKTLVFPAYRFLVQKKKSNTRSLRLRHLLLLLLRIGLIVLLCLALSRPRVQQETFGIINPEKPLAVVMVFDTTPSMGYLVGEQTRLDLARERALDLLDQLPDDCRVLVLDAADRDGFARETWHKSLEKARARIKDLTIRPTSVPVNEAIQEAYRRFESWDDLDAMHLPRFVCVFSDRTRPSWDSSAPIKRPDNVQTLYFDVGIDEPNDAAIVQASIVGGQESFLAGDRIALNVVVQATGAKLENTLVVELLEPKGRKASQIIPVLEPGKSQTLMLELETAVLAPGTYHAVVKLQNDPDAWLGNNQRFLTFRILERPRVLVLTTDSKRTEQLRVDLQWLKYDAHQANFADAPDLRKYDAVFLAHVAAPPEKLWGELASFVQSGGSVCIVPPGDELKREYYNSDAAQKVMPAKIVKHVESSGVSWNFADLDALQHSFMMYYRTWLDYDVVRQPALAFRYWQLEKEASPIVWYDDAQRHPAVLERIGGKKSGRVVFLTTPLDRREPKWNDYADNLKKDSHTLALLKSIGRYLCVPPENVSLNFQIGAGVPSYAHKGPAFPKFELDIGDASDDVSLDEGGWSGNRLSRPGNYTLVGVDGATRTPLFRFSVNIAPEESDLTRLPVSDIEAALGEKSVKLQDRRHSLRDSLDLEQPFELFPWLMIGLLFFLAIENLLANRFYRKEPGAT